MEKQNLKDSFREYGTIPLALLIGYIFLALVGYLAHTDNFITGFAISNQTTFSEQDASLALGKSNQVIDEMSRSGFNVARMKDLLEEARIEMSLKNYEKVLTISNDIENLKQKAFALKDEIKNATLRIDAVRKSGFNTAESEELLNLSIVEFTLENYESAEELIRKSTDKLNIFIYEEINATIKNINNLRKISLENNFNITRLEDTISNAKKLEATDVKKINVLKQEFLSLNKSVYMLVEAKNEIRSMEDAGFPTARVSNALNEAKFALELGYYDKIDEIIKNIKKLKSKAFEINITIKKARAKIGEVKEYGIGVNETETLLNTGENEFKLENYEDAEQLLKQSFEKTEKLLSESLLFGTISKTEFLHEMYVFLKRFWWLILVIAAIILSLSVVVFQRISIVMYEHYLRSLEKEKEAVLSLIKKAQIEYFKEKTIDKATYDLTVDKYQDRLIQIKEKIPLVNDKLARKKEKLWKFVRLKNNKV